MFSSVRYPYSKHTLERTLLKVEENNLFTTPSNMKTVQRATRADKRKQNTAYICLSSLQLQESSL